MKRKAATKQKCATCRHWALDKARRDKAGRLTGNPAPCNYPLPDRLPESVRPMFKLQCGWTCPSYGTECPCWEPRESADAPATATQEDPRIEKLRSKLCAISLASQNSMSSKEDCGRIAREALYADSHGWPGEAGR